MSLNKYWFKLNSHLPENCRCSKMEEALEDIKFSKDCITIWTDYNNCPNLLTTGLTVDLFETLLVRMVIDEPLLQFFKLAVIVSEDYIKDNKKGLETLEISKKYINERLAEYLPEDGKKIT
ncbi:MAG: hypothetical protein ACTHM7_08210 [Ginsengibacter sp.]